MEWYWASLIVVVLATPIVGLSALRAYRLFRVGRLASAVYVRGDRIGYHHEFASDWPLELEAGGTHVYEELADRANAKAARAKREAVLEADVKRFLYLDEQMVSQMWEQKLERRNLQLVRLTVDEEKSSAAGAQVGVPYVKAEGTRNVTAARSATYEPMGLSPHVQFDVLVDRLASEGKIHFGLEDAVPPKIPKRILAESTRFLSRSGLTLEDGALDRAATAADNSMAEEAMSSFAGLEGLVAMKQGWMVVESAEKEWSIERTIPFGPRSVQVRFVLDQKNLVPGAERFVVPGRKLDATAFGWVHRWDADQSLLMGEAVAVY